MSQPIRCVQPTLFMQGLVNSLRMFPGPQVLTAWSRLTFGVSPSRGRSGLASHAGEGLACPAPSRWLEFHACAVVENPAPHGARIPSWPWALPGDSIPPPHPRRNGFQLGGGVRRRTSHRKLARSDRGEISLFGHFLFGHRLLQTGLEQQVPAVCSPPGFFLLGPRINSASPP